MAYGESYLEYSRTFYEESTPVVVNTLTSTSALYTFLLVIIAFGSLSILFLGDIKRKNPVTFLLNAFVASISIGLGSIYISNYVGVYI